MYFILFRFRTLGKSSGLNLISENTIKNIRFPSSKRLFSSKVPSSSFRKMSYNTNAIIDSNFPASSLVPKSETGAWNFLQKFPEFNGKDVTIAIFDSGVDPKGSGLEAICDGTVKVIERFDCSGCGDTDTSKIVKASDAGTIIGVSGRSLKLTAEMLSSNKSGEYRVGLKSIHDLFPSKVRETFINLTKDKNWNEPHKKALADVAREIAAFEKNNPDASSFTLKQKQEKENLESLAEFLNNYEKKYASIKTSYDCVLYKTEDGWRSVIDTTENGDLANAVHIGEYTETHEVKNLNDHFSVSINVHDEGNVLEVVGLCSSHGTHVASIASANNSGKGDNEVDGVAPNAKIVSLTIGEGRLGSMETGTALVRAIIKVMELCNAGTKIDVINMSYGEHAHWANDGRIGLLMAEVVNKYGVVWVASAGNHGPALCTIGTPPDLKELCCVGVGAYVSPQMMEGEYSMREKLPANVYTWTSRDPCIDGGRAVTVCAPGAAITSVPEYTMSKSMLMNGTSMAAPHVAGAIALLISGLKQKVIKYSPYSIKRAISETATKLDYVDQFAQGNGLLNVERAFDHLVKYADEQENMVRFRLDCGKGKKGIHLRSGYLKKPHDYNVQIEPLFHNQDKADPKDKINFNLRLVLVSSQPWVKVGSYLDLCYTPRSIGVCVDPTGLPVGVHTAGIKAYDSACVEKGVMFEIPVTVVQPHVINTEITKSFQPDSPKEFKPNTIQRDFILVPPNATWAVLRMKSVKDVENQRGRFYVHTMQLIPDWYCKNMETQKLFDVKSGGNEVIHAFKCEENNILELCISKYWSNYGTTQLQYSLEFCGIKRTASSEYTMMHLNGVQQLDIVTLGAVDVQPIISLKTAVVPLRPTEAKITPLSPSRDVVPDGRQIYQNCLVYNLHLTKPAELSIASSVLSHVLYESVFESQLWMLFDTNKMMIACGDAYSSGNNIKLEKGDYTIRMQVRHEKKDLLEKLNDTALLIQHKLSTNLAPDVYDHYNQAVIGGKKTATVHLNGSTKPKCFYVAALPNEKINKANLPAGCTFLNGTIQLAKEELGRAPSSRRFKYVIGEQLEQNNKGGDGGGNAAGGASAAAGNGNKTDGKTTLDSSPNKGGKNNKSKGNSYDDYLEGIRDYQCSVLAKLDPTKAEEIYNEVVAAHPKHLSVHMTFIQNLESTVAIKSLYPLSFENLIRSQSSTTEPSKKVDVEKLSSVLKRSIELTDLVIKETNKDALLIFYGMKLDTRPDASKIKSTMDKQKNTLLEAYSKNGIAKCKLAILEQGQSDEVKTTLGGNLIEQIDSIFVEIQKFIDINDSKVLQFSIWHAYTNRHYGRYAKFLLKVYEEKLNKDVLEELSLIAKAREWKHLSQQIERQIVSANPGGFRPF